jgi:antitoxin YefM
MLIISTREFRDNQKKYLDLIDQNERIVIQRGKRSYMLKPLTETEYIQSDPEIMESLRQGIQEIKEGKWITIDPKNIWDSIK